MNRSLLFVALGGMIGSVCRFLVVSFAARLLPSSFPFGTFAVNLIGCFAIGAVAGLAERYAWLDQEWRVFLMAGLCGGFTTFSAFAFENLELLLARDYRTFAAYSLATFVLCLVSVFCGLTATRP